MAEFTIVSIDTVTSEALIDIQFSQEEVDAAQLKKDTDRWCVHVPLNDSYEDKDEDGKLVPVASTPEQMTERITQSIRTEIARFLAETKSLRESQPTIHPAVGSLIGAKLTA